MFQSTTFAVRVKLIVDGFGICVIILYILHICGTCKLVLGDSIRFTAVKLPISFKDIVRDLVEEKRMSFLLSKKRKKKRFFLTICIMYMIIIAFCLRVRILPFYIFVIPSITNLFLPYMSLVLFTRNRIINLLQCNFRDTLVALFTPRLPDLNS